jgi:hypothetical protein
VILCLVAGGELFPILHGCGFSEVSIGVAGRVVPVMHLIASSRLGAALLTTTMEHCRCRKDTQIINPQVYWQPVLSVSLS